jgi:hypothetical protein
VIEQRRGFIVLVVGLLGAVGLWLRLRHLGALPLIVDEGVQALAIRGILEHGFPQLESGLVYVRFLPLLYLQTATVEWFGLTPFALRLPGALIGAAIVVPGYLLGRILFGRGVGLLTAAVLAFSVWEIEFGRYARPYPFFQFFYVFALVFFYRGFMLDEFRSRMAFLVVAFAALTMHELSVLLVSCFILPYFVSSVPLRLRWTIPLWAGAFLLLRFIHISFGEWVVSLGPPYTWGTVEQLTAGAGDAASISDRIRAIFRLPSHRLPNLGLPVRLLGEHLWFMGLVTAIVAVALALLLRAAKRSQVSARSALLAAAALPLAALHQFTLAALVLLTHSILYGRSWRFLREPAFAIGAVATALLFLAWLPMVGIPRRSVLSAFAFPNVWNYMVQWLVIGWPLMTAVVVAAIVLLLVRFRNDRSDPAPVFAVGAVLVPAVAAATFQSYQESRYFFHLYPAIVVLFSWGVLRASAPLFALLPQGRPLPHAAAALVLTVAVLFISQDANPVSAWKIGDRTPATARDPVRAVISWQPYASFHQDHEVPGRYVGAHRGPEDIVIVAGPLHAIALFHLYAGGVDWTINPRPNYGYTIVRDGRTQYYLTGSGVVSAPAELDAIIDAAPAGVWFLGDFPLLTDENRFYPEETKAYLRGLSGDPVVIGRDGQTFAVRVR